MQIIPPRGFGCFADARLVFQDELTKFVFKTSVQSCGYSLEFSHEFCGVVLERALGDLTTQASAEHDDFEGAEFVASEAFAFERLEDSD